MTHDLAEIPYAVALLTPSRLPGAEAANAPLLGAMTLGVEVTEADLAARCGLGVIDPQHGFGTGNGRAAIEAGLTWPLPPTGALLVTIRPDADAFGAMAVLNLRARGVRFDDAVLARILLVTRCDAFDNGDWEAWVAERGPLAGHATLEAVSMFPLAYAEAAALAAGRGRSPGARAAAFEAWLITGEVPADCRDAARTFVKDLAAAYNDGRVVVTPREGVAWVRGRTPGGMGLGYRSAPVVIASRDDGARRQIAVAQFGVGHLDLHGVGNALRGLEPGWGGSATIIGSPQGVGSILSDDTIDSIVRAHLIASPRSATLASANCAVVKSGREGAER
jgi:hypothetical protein